MVVTYASLIEKYVLKSEEAHVEQRIQYIDIQVEPLQAQQHNDKVQLFIYV